MKKTLSFMAIVCLIFLCGCSAIKTSAPVEIGETEYKIYPMFNENTNPQNWNIRWEVFADGKPVESFKRSENINFEHADNYYNFEGISTFRGNNYRTDPTFGNVNVTENSLEVIWEHVTGQLGEWSGSGWTGQPLIVRWEDETKQMMDIYPPKKSKQNLTEVIYATMDGNVYFYDLEDGEPTRDKLRVGMTFKGTGTLDPRGYPIMYIGSGIANAKSQRMYVIDLIQNKVIYEQSGSDPKAFRSWVAFDSSPIIDAKTDTLIWPGENGVLYTLKLNTVFDKQNKKITINPENTAKCRYRSSFTDKGRWHGYESSCVAVGNHVYVSENSGMVFCVDLNTMELKWAQDTLDDTNSTPVFEWEKDGEGAIYTAPALRWTAKGAKGSTTIFKLDAKNGNILWSYTHDCVQNRDSSGGVQSTPAIGRKGSNLENFIFYNIASTPSTLKGLLLAFDKQTGEIVWEHVMENYTWSSPVAVYNDGGKGYIVICDSIGDVKLLDGTNGNMLGSVNIGSNVEASPAIFENTLVVGTRGCKIYGIKLK